MTLATHLQSLCRIDKVDFNTIWSLALWKHSDMLLS